MSSSMKDTQKTGSFFEKQLMAQDKEMSPASDIRCNIHTP
jgi:hypothetical protein